MKNVVALSALMLVTAFAYSQTSSKKNAEIVIKCMKESGCEKVNIISGQYSRDYAGDWLQDIAIEDDFSCLKRGNLSTDGT